MKREARVLVVGRPLSCCPYVAIVLRGAECIEHILWASSCKELWSLVSESRFAGELRYRLDISPECRYVELGGQVLADIPRSSGVAQRGAALLKILCISFCRLGHKLKRS